jgi:fibronectin type 3 domain-containing protein
VINSVLATSAGYTDSEVTAGSTYFYVVTAVDASNTESDPSTEASAKVPSP